MKKKQGLRRTFDNRVLRRTLGRKRESNTRLEKTAQRIVIIYILRQIL
jgi:hypothetical protein